MPLVRDPSDYLREDLPQPGLRTRLRFFWALGWTAATAVPLGAGLLVHNAARPAARTFKWWATVWARGILLASGVRLEAEVRAELPADRAFVFVANHQNELDIATCLIGIPHPFGFTAKAALERVPVLGRVLRRTPCVFVDRSSPRRAIESIREAGEQIRSGNSVLVFAEGERTWGPRLLPFLRGAFVLALEAGVPIVPVTVVDNYRVLDERVLAGHAGTVRLVVGEPVPTAGKRRSDLPALMAAVHAEIERELGRFHGGGRAGRPGGGRPRGIFARALGLRVPPASTPRPSEPPRMAKGKQKARRTPRPAKQPATPKPEAAGSAGARPAKVRSAGASVPQETAWGRLPARTQHLVGVGFLVLVCLGFLWPVTFGPYAIVGEDTVQWRGQAEAMQQYEERTGRLALWAPNTFGGMPGYLIHYPKAVPQLDTAVRALRAAGWWPGAHFLVLLLGAYLFAVFLTRDVLAGVLAAVAYGLTTYVPLILLAGHNTKFVAMAYAPWLLLAFAFVLRRPPDAGWPRVLLGGLLFAIALAVNLRAGHVQITYYVAFVLGVVWITEGVGAVREGAGRAFLASTGALALGAVLGVAMVAHPYLPVAEYRAFTIRASGEGGGLGWDYAMRWSQGFGEMVTLLIPGAYGGGGATYWGEKPFTAGPHYVGPLVLALAVAGLWGVRRRITLGLGIAAGVMVLLAFGRHLPLINRPAFDLLPLLNSFRVPETWLAAVALVVAVLAGVGAYYLGRREPTPEGVERKTRVAYWTFGATAGVLLLLLAGGGALFSFEAPGELERTARAAAQQYGRAPSDPAVRQAASQYVAGLRAERADLFTADAVRSLFFLLLGGGLVVLQRRRRIPAWAMQVGLLLLVTVDLWRVGQRYFNDEAPSLRTSSEILDAIPEYGVDRFIRAQVEVAGGPGHFRVLPLALNPFNSAREATFYESVGGYHGAKLALAQDYIDELIFDADGRLNENALDLLATRYVIARGPAPGFRVAFEDEQTGLVVLEKPDALPRAYLAEETRVVEDREERLRLLRDPDLDLRRTALLNEPLPQPLDPAPIDSLSTAGVELVRFDPREIVWEVATDRPRLMVASEVYYPAGWSAYVDDRPAPIVQTNHLLRGVVVPEGEHIVSMRFEPETHERSALISIVATALAYLGALLMAGLWWYRRGHPA